MANKFSSSLHQLAELNMTMKAWPIAFSFAITLACVFLATTAWYLILKGMGAPTRWRTCAPTYLVAAMGRYLPGYVWRHLGMAYLTKRQGVGLKQASFAVLWEFLGIAAIRGAIAITTVSPDLFARFLSGALNPYLNWLRIGIWVLLVLSPIILERVADWGKRSEHPVLESLSINKRALWLALVADLLANILYGLGFAVLLRSVYEIEIQQFVAAIFSTSISWLLSLLAFFVPGGLGVRESIIIYTLENVFPSPVVIIGALMSRAVLILAEVSGALLGLYLWSRSRLCK